MYKILYIKVFIELIYEVFLLPQNIMYYVYWKMITYLIIQYIINSD